MSKISDELRPQPAGVGVQCCMCGKTGLSTIEGDGGTECQLEDGRWTCSEPCWEKAGGYGPDLSPAEGEPVAWQYRNAAGGVWLTPEFERRTAYGRTGMQERPLFAAPSNLVISDEMVERARHAHANNLDNGGHFTSAMHAALTAALAPS